MVNCIKYAVVQFTCNIVTDILELIKVNPLSKLHSTIYDSNQLVDFFIISLFVFALNESWHLKIVSDAWSFEFIVIGIEADSLARTQVNGDVL